jgi:type IV secretion system protein TrbD
VALRSVPIRRVGNRTNLILGGDREGVLLAGVLAVPLPLLGQTWFAVVFALALWFGALATLRAIAKEDPRMREVYIRHRLYRDFYPPRATPFRLNGPIQAARYK